MDVAHVKSPASSANVSRSGYTGEDGFEISVPASKAASIWPRALLDDPT